jgi:hypothetical protein
MNQFRYRLAQFLYGRNGVDALGYATMALLFVVAAVNSFTHIIWLTALEFLLLGLMLYRVLSRDLTRRRGENARFLRLFNGVKGWFTRFFCRIRDIKTHRYRVCSGCKVTLRLPVKRGKHTVICPRCKRRVAVRVWL